MKGRMLIGSTLVVFEVLIWPRSLRASNWRDWNDSYGSEIGMIWNLTRSH